MALIQIRVRLKFMTLMTLNMTLNMTLCGQCSWAYDACDASSLTHAHARTRTIILFICHIRHKCHKQYKLLILLGFFCDSKYDSKIRSVISGFLKFLTV